MNKLKPFRFWKKWQNKNGFTMTEITVTLSILSIMTAISVPSYLSWLPRHRLQTSVRQIYDDMNLAKFRAVKDNTVAVITFDNATDTYKICLDDMVQNGSCDPGETILRNDATLARDVNITLANSCGFNNRGLRTTGTDQIVQLTNPTGRNLRIDVSTAGGISIETL